MRYNIVLNKVTNADCKDLWEWRNNHKIRKNFFNTHIISWQEHKKWFYSKIKDPNTKIYIAYQGKSKIGVIRFGIKNDSVKVSVNLNPDFLCKGFGSRIIDCGTKKFLNETGIKKQIIAEIKKNNVVSQKAFGKSGYFLVAQKQNIVIFSYNKIYFN